MKVNLMRESETASILINAISAEAPRDWQNKFKLTPGDPVIDLEVTVNGVAVPFLSEFSNAINRYFKTQEQAFDQRVREAALELVKAPSLEGLRRSIEDVEYHIERAIEQAQKLEPKP